MSEASLRVLIVDDEPLARQRIAELLEGLPGIEIAGYATNGEGAIEEIRELDPDLVFLDVQMPVKTGLDVVREIGPDAMPPTIFVTAFDQYALHAFDVAAVDYLVKPFDDERFEQALRRARRTIELEQVGQLAERLRSVLRGASSGTKEPAQAPHEPGYLERIAVESRGQVRVVPVEAIDYITASAAYVVLHTGRERLVVRERLQELEERLDPARFIRVHRSTIVQLGRVVTLLRGGGGDYAVRLHDGTELKVSRGRVEELERKLGL